MRYIVLSDLVPVEISSQKYALTLTARFRLNDECLSLAEVELFFKAFNISGELPRLREEAVCVGKLFLHRVEVLSQEILAC